MPRAGCCRRPSPRAAPIRCGKSRPGRLACRMPRELAQSPSGQTARQTALRTDRLPAWSASPDLPTSPRRARLISMRRFPKPGRDAATSLPGKSNTCLCPRFVFPRLSMPGRASPAPSTRAASVHRGPPCVPCPSRGSLATYRHVNLSLHPHVHMPS